MIELEAIEKMREIAKNDDVEARHIDADQLIIEFLLAKGFEGLAAEYDILTAEVWYA